MKTLLQVLALLCTLQFSALAQTGQKWALLIGVDTYQNEAMTPLRFATRDTKAMRDALLKQGYSDDTVFSMTSDATGADYPSSLNVLKRLSALGERIKENDTFLFYFSGHGFQGDAGHFLATGDADPTDAETLERSALPLEALKKKMQKISARNAIFIIDACRDNPEKGSKGAPNTMSEDFSKDLRLVAKSTAGGQSGSAILLSCSQGQRSWEWDEKNHGVFTYFLVEGLNGAASNANGEMTMADLGDYVQKKVSTWSVKSLKKQTPDMQQFGAAKIIVAQSKKNPILDSLQIKPEPIAPAEIVETSAHLTFTSTPDGAAVYVDGVMIGRTDMAYQYELGFAKEKTIEVGFELNGYKSEIVKVPLSRGVTKPIAIQLAKSEAILDNNRPEPLPQTQTAIFHEMCQLLEGPGTFATNNSKGTNRNYIQFFLSIRGGYLSAKRGLSIAVAPAKAETPTLLNTVEIPLKFIDITQINLERAADNAVIHINIKMKRDGQIKITSDGKTMKPVTEFTFAFANERDAERFQALFRQLMRLYSS